MSLPSLVGTIESDKASNIAFKTQTNTSLLASRILIVDDEPVNVCLLKSILKQAGYSNITCLRNPLEVRQLCVSQVPDLVLLDLNMPGCDGFGVLEDLKFWRDHHYLPVLMLTATSDPQTCCRALAAGAKDFVAKPFHAGEILLRVHNLLETAHLQRCLRDQNNQLELRVYERTQELEQLNFILMKGKVALRASQLEILERLAQAAEFRDDDTGQHTQRVGEMAGRIAEAIGWKPARVELLRLASPLHDVGKIGIPDSILLKPGKLTADEFATVKQHAQLGAHLLQNGRSALVSLAHSIALNHHERFDGRGYPHGLQSDNIPLEGRIVAVADVYDALTHHRPYKAAWSCAEAIAEIQRGAGTQFDPGVVKAFSEVVESTLIEST